MEKLHLKRMKVNNTGSDAEFRHAFDVRSRFWALRSLNSQAAYNQQSTHAVIEVHKRIPV